MSLEDEILAGRQSVHTDNTKMSFGELANLYKDGDIIISPEFQRTFRWSNSQKTRLIESILLGIPLPSIFVAAELSMDYKGFLRYFSCLACWISKNSHL